MVFKTSKKTIYALVLLLCICVLIAIGYRAHIKSSTIVSYNFDTKNNSLVFTVTKPYVIESCDTKYGTVLKNDISSSNVLYILSTGTEFITVNYIDQSGNKDYCVFDVVVNNSGTIVVAQLNKFGIQVNSEIIACSLLR